MASEELITYIKGALEQGHSREEISENLSANGWTQEDIQEAYTSIGQVDQKMETASDAQDSKDEGAEKTERKGLFRETPRSLRIYFTLGGIFGLIASLQPYFELQERQQLRELFEITSGGSTTLPPLALGVGDYVYMGVSFLIAMFLIYMAANMKKFIEKHSTFLVWWLVATFAINSYGVYAERRSIWLIVIFGVLAMYLIVNIKRLANKPLKQFIPKKVLALLGIIILGGLGVQGYKAYQEFNIERITDSADYDSLQLIQGNFFTDGKYVFYAEGEYAVLLLKGVKLDEFEYVGGMFGKDSTNVYFASSVIEGANPATFEYIERLYSKDDKNVYFRSTVLEGADTQTFQRLGDGIAKDGKNAYYLFWVIEGVDVDTFELVGGNFTKDDTNVYSGKNILPDADPNTFEYVGDYYAKDVNSVYFATSVIEGADPNTFEYVGEGRYDSYAKDKDFVYEDAEMVEGVNPEDCTSDNVYRCSK